ncbi:hypothetical protein GCM10010384_60720 [Streptomyces djakartensis]|uniref:Cytochrome P450 n=1 Tax=Streptomyces djakartensis TaxID=68193 RepID=A0ABQ3ACC9_9ACTN|nr:hypothetical protein GCM10010384_60720 [Streptomyces djakartensis]
MLRDPFGAYAEIRAQAPLVRAAYPWGAVQWLATRYSDVKAVLTDPRLVNDPANVPGMNLPHPGLAPRPGAGRRDRPPRGLLLSAVHRRQSDRPEGRAPWHPSLPRTASAIRRR